MKSSFSKTTSPRLSALAPIVRAALRVSAVLTASATLCTANFVRTALTVSAVFTICATLTACGPSVEHARANFPQISKKRPLGTKCSIADSASVKRATSHPYGPTGGWYDRNDTLVDYERTTQRDSNHLEMDNGCISGFVRFDKPGYLHARSYDDYFGDVYCGWAPVKLQLKPTDKFVFVSLGTCSVGDGGLDQVHEVAWFPENSSEGTLIFSTAYPIGEKLGASETYRPELLGTWIDAWRARVRDDG